MLSIALLHLDGTYSYYSCDLGIDLLKSITDRGKWSSKLKSAYFDYKDNNVLSALINYMELAFLGEQTAEINAAMILEYLHVLDNND